MIFFFHPESVHDFLASLQFCPGSFENTYSQLRTHIGGVFWFSVSMYFFMRLQGACMRALVIVSLFQCSVCFQVCLQYICVEASKIALMVFLQYVFPNCLFRRQHKGTRCTSKLFLLYVFSCASLNCGFCSNRILHYFPMCVCQSITDVTSQVFTMI